MSDRRRRFDPEELRGGDGTVITDAELAAALAAARALESSVGRDHVTPTEGFEDRVMAAIAVEALPKAVVRPAGTVRGGRPAAFLTAVRDAWGVAMSGGRPLMVRAQAMSFVLMVVLATGSLTAVAAIGAAGILSGPDPSISPTPTTVIPTPSTTVPSPSPSISPSPSPTTSDDGSAEPTESPEPGETPGAGSEDPSDSAEPTRTPKPTKTPRPSSSPDETDEPDESDDPDETDEPDESDDPDESDKP